MCLQCVPLLFSITQGVTDRNELDFLRTLSMIKSKNDKIYHQDAQFFDLGGRIVTSSTLLFIPIHSFLCIAVHSVLESSHDEGKVKRGEEKPLYLKDYERQRLLERGVLALVSDSEEEEPDQSKVRYAYCSSQSPTHNNLIPLLR